ncbi:MAG TPA: phosphatase PAP2 family protein [Polyangiaceae bacterium]
MSLTARNLEEGGPVPADAPEVPPGRMILGLYLAVVLAMVVRIARFDDWNLGCWAVLLGFAATFGPDRVARPSRRSLALAVLFFGVLSYAFAYLPDVWFRIAFVMNHAEHYLVHADGWMASLPFNDGAFLWRHRSEPLWGFMRWIYITGFDMVVWIPVVRSLVACDAWKVLRYALAAHLVQFPLIMPFFTAFRVDEVWCVLGHPDGCLRGWDAETMKSLGANCFPSMHTSVAFAILLLGLRERSRFFRFAMAAYATTIIVSTVYLEIHWLVDIAGGIALGALSVAITDWIVQRLQEGPMGAVPATPDASALGK